MPAQGGGPEPVLARLDAALLALRRMTEAPAGGRSLRHGGGRVEVSTVLVVDAVARAGGPTSVRDVAAALRVAHSTASRLVDRAVRAGAVERRRAGDDPRRVELRLTGAGEDLQREAIRFRTARLAALLDPWAQEDVAALADLLGRFAAEVRRQDVGAVPDDAPAPDLPVPDLAVPPAHHGGTTP